MDLRLLARLVLSLVAGSLAAWMVALFVGLSSNSVTATIVLRSILGVAILAMLTRIVMRRAYDEPANPAKLLVAGLLAYLLSPVSWAGRALAAQLLLDPGWATYALDLVTWVAVVLLAGLTARTRGVRTQPRPYQLS